MESGDAVGAENTIKKILKSKPKHLDANINLAIIYVKQEKFGRALRHLRTVVGQNDKIAVAHHLIGYCFMGLRKPEDSARSYHSAVTIDPKLSDCWFNLGLMRRETNDSIVLLRPSKRSPNLPQASAKPTNKWALL